MLDARALSKWYGAIRAVSDVSFSLAAGEVLGYLGPNGSGKTTTVGMLTGLVDPTAGAVVFQGPTSRTIRSSIAVMSATCRKNPTSIRI